MTAPLWRAALVSVGLTAAAVLCVVVGAHAAPTAPAAITSVTFTGGESKPTITVHGRHLGTRPPPNPTYVPLGHPPLCPPSPVKPAAAYGLDYGTRLFLADHTQKPVWSAGHYRPRLNELDCVGLMVVKFTPGLVVLRLGAFYREAHLRLAAGDAFSLAVNSARLGGHVRYR